MSQDVWWIITAKINVYLGQFYMVFNEKQLDILEVSLVE